MRIVVTGDRSWQCDELAATLLQRLIARHGPDLVIVHGGDCGVDDSFNRACEKLRIAVDVRVANWRQTGIPTVGARNRELIKDGADLCIALHRSIAASQRTKDCVRQAIPAGIPTILSADRRAIPSRLTAGDPRLG